MPKVRIKVNAEQAEMLGDLRGASRELERIADRAERALLKFQEKGGTIANPAALDRVAGYRARADDLRSRLDEARRIEQAVDKSLPGRLRRMMNTHNPHGRLRQILSGNLNAGTVDDVGGALRQLGAVLAKNGSTGVAKLGASLARGGSALSAAAVRAGPGIAISSVLTHHLMGKVEERDQQHERMVAIMGKGASERLRRSIENRFSSDTGALDFQRQQRQILARQEELDAHSASSVPGFTSYEHAERLAKGRERRAELADWLRRHTSTFGKDSGGRFQSARFLNSPDVEYKMSLGAMLAKDTSYSTVGQWLKQETWDRLTGARDEKKREFAIEMAEKARKDAEEKLKHEAMLYWSDPRNQVAAQSLAWHQREVNEFMLMRNLQWNPL